MSTAGADAVTRLREVEREIFSRRPEHSIEPTLDRISALATVLGDPQRACPVIHITGTNGKSSTARMIETLLRARGLRTGLFTSPHLSSVRERIRIDGEPVTAERFVAAHDDIAACVRLVDERQPFRLSFFEVLAGMAFAAFADAPVDVAVVEVGLGGTWDATNIADGSVAVVTPVAIDHTAYLGNTLESIAGEKAGIIKPGAVAVLGRQPEAAAEVLLGRAAEVGAGVVREDAEFGVISRELAVGGQLLAIRGLGGEYSDLMLPLFGEYQASNAACALAAVEAFSGAGIGLPGSGAGGRLPGSGAGVHPRPAGWPGTDGGSVVMPEAGLGGAGRRNDTPAAPRADSGASPLDAGLGADVGGSGGSLGAGVGGSGGSLDPGLVREAFSAMTAPGRLEVVRRSPVVIVDSAHNPAGMAATMGAVTEAFGFDTLVGVLGVSADKDVVGILDEMEPVVSELVVTNNASVRSMRAPVLAEHAEGVFGADRVRVADRLDDAIEVAVGLVDEAASGAGPGGAGVLVTGSVITAGEARVLLGAEAAVDGS